MLGFAQRCFALCGERQAVSYTHLDVYKRQGMGFIVNKTEVANDQIAKGAVIGYKDYKVGDTAPYGSKLTITVSLGAETSA